MKKVNKILLALIVLFIVIQFIPSGIPDNLPEDERSITKSSLVTAPVLDQLKKSCFDCHSNQVNLPWYAKVAPSSWLLSAHIREGKSHLNFSAWDDYSKREKTGLLEEISDEVEAGNMPLKSYLLIHRDAKLNSEKISVLSEWIRETTTEIMEGGRAVLQ